MAAKCTLASRVDGFHESSDGKVTVQMSCELCLIALRRKQTPVIDLSLFTGRL